MNSYQISGFVLQICTKMMIKRKKHPELTKMKEYNLHTFASFGFMRATEC